MRITTSMTNNATMDAGMSLTGNTLASYLNGDTTDSMAASLGKKHHVAKDAMSKGKFEKLKEAAEKLEQYTGALSTTGNKSVFEKARKSGDATEVQENVEKMVSAYNSMMDKMRTDTSTLGGFYYQSMKEVVTENRDALSTLGISVDKNGRMSMDKERLKAADLDKVERIFGAEGTLSSRLNMIAGKVADSAQANLKSASSQYDAAGNSVDALLRNYDAKR